MSKWRNHPKRPKVLVCWICGRRLYGNAHRVVTCDDPTCAGHPAHHRCANERAEVDP